MSRYGEVSLWMVVNDVLDRYHAGLATKAEYLAAFDQWHAERRESNRRQVARCYGERYGYPRENEGN